MVNIPNSVIEKINRFLELLKENHISVQKSYLYGSYANGTYNEWSDIDLAIISDDFSGNSFLDKVNLIDIIFQSGKDISPMPFKSEDFENSPFARDEILKKGIKIS